MIRVSIRALLFVCLFGLLNLSGQIPRPEVSPTVIARDAVSGRAAVRAVRLKDPLRMDGRLDEAVYRSVPAISDFVQMEPHSGLPATEKTELWILFDDENVYVTFRCWETHPERMVVKEMRHDNSNLWMGENVAFMFDTFHDRRNGVEFGVTPSGGRYEGRLRMSVTTTVTGIPSGRSPWDGFKAVGLLKRQYRSRRSAIGRGAPKSGASRLGASTRGRTSFRF